MTPCKVLSFRFFSLFIVYFNHPWINEALHFFISMLSHFILFPSCLHSFFHRIILFIQEYVFSLCISLVDFPLPPCICFSFICLSSLVSNSFHQSCFLFPLFYHGHLISSFLLYLSLSLSVSLRICFSVSISVSLCNVFYIALSLRCISQSQSLSLSVSLPIYLILSLFVCLYVCAPVFLCRLQMSCTCHRSESLVRLGPWLPYNQTFGSTWYDLWHTKSLHSYLVTIILTQRLWNARFNEPSALVCQTTGHNYIIFRSDYCAFDGAGIVPYKVTKYRSTKAF